MTEETKILFDRFIQCLQLVASDPEEQISLFPDFVDIPDEIALEYNHRLTWLNQNYSEKLINEEEINKLKQIDDLFTRMSLDKSINYWDLKALRNASEWELARNMAKEVLNSLGIKKTQPI
jgi:hypothetical protein